MDAEKARKSKKSKHQDDQKDDQITNNLLDQLPYETLIDILSRLPITSLIHFTLLSRSSNSLSHDPHLVNMHLARSSTPCLIFHSDYPIQNQLHFLHLSDLKVRKINTPFPISEFTIIGSSNGLLCVINTLFPSSIFFYNPFTRFHSEIPKNFNFQKHIIVYGFGFHPATNDYKVIKIAYYSALSLHPIAKHFRGFETNSHSRVSEVEIYSSRSNTWKNRGVVPYRLEKYSSPGVLVDGRLHWVSRLGRFNDRVERTIVSFDLADDSFRMIKNPDSSSRGFGRWVGCCLASLDGYLCGVVPRGNGSFDVWMMKEYGVNESWVKEYSVGVYCPVSMISHKMETSSHIWRNMFSQKLVRVLCVLESGELLLEYRGGGLVCYDLQSGSFKEVGFLGMPKLYQTMVHVGSLVSVET
ncbi:hypothetical protein ACS0TY_012411 [Phlomoides rotata]